MKPSELVRKGWCRGWLARDEEGNEVEADDSSACQWCAEGAIICVFGKGGALQVFYSFRRIIGCVRIFEWNDKDSRTQAEVIAALEEVEKEMGI